MALDLLISVGAAETRIAAVEDGVLQSFDSEITLDADAGPQSRISPRSSMVGDILLGRVVRVLPAIQAAFVDIGLARAGFLGAREARVLSDKTGPGDIKISETVCEGDTVLVQIVKDPIGDKGARLTAAVTLAGRLLVLTPMHNGFAVSHRITDESEISRLHNIGHQMVKAGGEELAADAGYIFRTNAAGAALEEVLDEARTLSGRWREIESRRKAAVPPELIYNDLGPIERVLRDKLRPDARRILIDDAGGVAAAKAFCQRVLPEMTDRVEQYTASEPLFDAWDLETDIARLLQPRVPLAGGGWITVEMTEALTAIDVNSGSFTDASGIADLSYQVNLLAAKEIGRQLRLRGIGGVIVIDFIHMEKAGEGETVLETLRQSLAYDGQPVEVAPLSPFGLAEVTRKRIREPRAKRLTEGCSTCLGSGREMRPVTVALRAIRQIERAARAVPGAEITVTAAPDVVAWLDSMGIALRDALAGKGAVRIHFVADSGRRRENFDVDTRK